MELITLYAVTSLSPRTPSPCVFRSEAGWVHEPVCAQWWHKIYALIRNRTPTDFSAHNLVIRTILTELCRFVCTEVDFSIEKFILIWFYPRMESEAEGTEEKQRWEKRRKCRRKMGWKEGRKWGTNEKGDKAIIHERKIKRKNVKKEKEEKEERMWRKKKHDMRLPVAQVWSHVRTIRE